MLEWFGNKPMEGGLGTCTLNVPRYQRQWMWTEDNETTEWIGVMSWGGWEDGFRLQLLSDSLILVKVGRGDNHRR